jgi:hypothetical protein
VPGYRRNRVPGGTFFFTVNLRDPRSDLLVTQIDILRNAVRRVRARRPFRTPFRIDAWIVRVSICMVYGSCHKAMATSPAGGAQSKPHW